MNVVRWVSAISVAIVFALLFFALCHPVLVSGGGQNAVDFCGVQLLMARQQGQTSVWFVDPPLYFRLWPFPPTRFYR
jgi:hypothetical protein